MDDLEQAVAAEEQAAAEPKELPVGVTENRMLPCRLDAGELVEAVNAACAARHEVEAREKELKETTSDLRELLKAAEAGFNHQMELLEQGKGDKSVPCEERLDYENGVVYVHRLDVEPDDPDRVVERRAMTDEERQASLPMDAPAVDGAGQVYDPAENALTEGEEADLGPRPIVCPHCGQDHPAEECPGGEAPQRVEHEKVTPMRKRRKA